MTLKHSINKPVEFVFEHLTDMQKFRSVHPVIFKIDHKGNGNYLIHERLKLGFIPITFTYPASVHGFKNNHKVVMKAVVMKLSRIDMSFEIKEIQGGSEITETIGFKSLLPIRPLMERIFKEQHTQLFKNINALKLQAGDE